MSRKAPSGSSYLVRYSRTIGRFFAFFFALSFSAGPLVGAMPTTRQTLLSIPFPVPAATEQGETPTEVRLFVAIDGASEWTFVSKTSPNSGRFIYRAREDATYCFLVQAVFQSSNGAHKSKVLCNRGVLVDTNPPHVTLKGARGNGGQITVSWRAEDTNLAENTTKLLYRIGPENQWQSVAIDRGGVLRNQQGESGRVTWWVPDTQKPIDIRGEFTDQAGNMAVGHYRLQTDDQNEGGPQAQQVSAPTRPTQKRPPVLRTLDFELEYDVDGIRPEQIREVQLWGTSDEGTHWQLIASDPDCTSPISASVKREGRYGFRIVAAAADGVSTFRPTAGTVPEICLEFDHTPPLIRFTSAQFKDEEELAITWEATDSRLGHLPVSLFRGPSLNGPWTELASNRPNTGVLDCQWKSSKTPSFLRIDVIDEAGNIGSQVSAYPVPFEIPSPVARIREVRPRSQTATRQHDSPPLR